MKILAATDASDWINVDDPVMGGVSRSHTTLVGAALVFAGEVSLANSGGFCSTRTEGRTWNLPAEISSFALTVRGDGRRYKFTVRTDANESGSYRHDFQTRQGELTSHVFAIGDFEMYRRGKHLPDAPELDPKTVRSIGMLISEAQAGAFKLEIIGIEAA